MTLTFELGKNFAQLLERVCTNNNQQILDKLENIMATQDEINEKVGTLQASNERFETQLTAIRQAIAEERAQVDILVANNPNLDFTALDAAIAKTTELVASSEGVDEETADIYQPETEEPV